MPVFINDNGTWKEITQPKVNLAGTWTDLTEMFVNVGGTWQSVWAAGAGGDIYLVSKSATASSLNSAIAAMTNGGTLLFGEGTWELTESLVIGRSNVTLTGSGPGVTHLRTNGNFGTNALVKIAGTSGSPLDGVLIENMTLDGRTLQAKVSRGLSVGWAHRVTIRACVISNHAKEGLYVEASSMGSALNQTVIANNQLDGLYLYTGADDWLITGNLIANNALSGVKLRQSKRALLSDNAVRNNGENGIRVTETSTGTLLTRNATINNGIDGISIQGSADCLAAFNTASANGNDGLYLTSGADGCAVYANTSLRNDWSGVSVGNSGSPAGRVTLSANVLALNTRNGMKARDNSSVVAVGNQINGNTLPNVDSSGNTKTVYQNMTNS